MRLRRLLCALVFCLSAFVTVFSGASIDAYAFSDGRFMTSSESLSIFGSEISFQYFNGSDYVDSTFNYVDSTTISAASSDTDLVGCNVLHYVGNVSGYSTDPNYINIDIRPAYSIFDTSQLYTCIALSNKDNYYPVNPPYSSPQWEWFWSGSNVTLQPSSIPQAMMGNYRYYTTYVRASFTSQSATSGYSIRACFYGNTPTNNQFHLFLMCPYVDSGSSGASGTYTTGSSGGSDSDINVNVDVDLTETNGILDSILSALSAIVNGIRDLFVPEQTFVQSWIASVHSLLLEVFGSYSGASAMLDQAFDTLTTGSAVESVSFPAISIPDLSGGSITLYKGGTVPLLPASGNYTVSHGFFGRAGFYDYMKYLIDILATMAVLNMIHTKFKAVLVGETVVDMDGDDE